MGNVEDAEMNLKQALDIYKALHGENHRIIAATLNYLGYAYQQMERVKKGKEILERAVEIMEKYSPPHPGNLQILKARPRFLIRRSSFTRVKNEFTT